MLFMLGSVPFEVFPVNLDGTILEYGGDFAAKDVIGAARPFEFTGPADTVMSLKGKLFPQKFGLGSFADLQSMAQGGQPQMLLRGDGAVFGWQIIEKVKETHSFLDENGAGRIIEFSIDLKQSPDGAGAQSMMSLLLGLFQP